MPCLPLKPDSFWSRRFSGGRHRRAAFLIVFLLALLGTGLFFWDFTPAAPTAWGVTFSQYYAQEELGLDWQKTYLAILDDLKVDHLRLAAYWNHLEAEENFYDFGDLDWQIRQAADRGAKVILAVGRKLPRWPECHDPRWLKKIGAGEIQKKQLAFVRAVIKRYRGHPAVTGFQIENEPYLKLFGQCPTLDKNFFRQEVALANTLTDKPILVTDSGELSLWFEAAASGSDWLGITMYRVVYNEDLGYLKYYWPPIFYRAKVFLAQKLFGIKKVIVAELQAEAWHPAETDLSQTPLSIQEKSLSPEQLQKNISLARRAGFDEVYLWGAEWWYWLKTEQGQPQIWQIAQKLWAK